MTYPSGPEGFTNPADQPPIYVPSQAPSPAAVPPAEVSSETSSAEFTAAFSPYPYPAAGLSPAAELSPSGELSPGPSPAGDLVPGLSPAAEPWPELSPAGDLPTPMPPGGYPPTQPAPPTYDPALTAQLSPGYSQPYGFVPAPAPAAPKRTVVVVLSALLGLFVLATGVFGSLFVTKSQESAQRAEQLAAANSDRDRLRADLAKTQRELQDSDDEVKDMTTERDAIADCLNAIYAWWDALEGTNNQDTPATETLRKKAVQLCADADKYL